jgi:hypothetical protein
VRFEFRLLGVGWAEGHITDGTNHATFTASYTTDALDDLLYAVWRLLEGDAETRCSWQDEPGESRWIMRRQGDDVSVRVLGYSDYSRKLPDESGQPLFETLQPTLEFARAVALGASRTLQRHGTEGYEFEWHRGPFPARTLELIQEEVARRSTPKTDKPGA